MEEIIVYRQDLLSALTQVLNELSQTVTAIPTTVWHIPFGQDSHTPHFILARLRELEEQMFTSTLHRIEVEDLPQLVLFDDKAWMAEHYQADKSAQIILAEYSALHTKEVTWLGGLPAASWSRIGRHPWWGVHTFQWWVELQLDYSRQHIERLSTILAL